MSRPRQKPSGSGLLILDEGQVVRAEPRNCLTSLLRFHLKAGSPSLSRFRLLLGLSHGLPFRTEIRGSVDLQGPAGSLGQLECNWKASARSSNIRTMIRFGDILAKVEKFHPNEDLNILRRAYVFSAKEHDGQIRKSGEPYFNHPLAVGRTSWQR